jgi:hypothetical protein
MTHNVSHVCDVAPSPTRARGHVAERRAAAPRSLSHPAGAPMYIRAVICRCAVSIDTFLEYSLPTCQIHMNDIYGLSRAAPSQGMSIEKVSRQAT